MEWSGVEWSVVGWSAGSHGCVVARMQEHRLHAAAAICSAGRGGAARIAGWPHAVLPSRWARWRQAAPGCAGLEPGARLDMAGDGAGRWGGTECGGVLD